MTNTRLLYLGFLFFTACLVSSCTSDSPDVKPVDKGVELSFAVKGLTRGSVITDISTPGSKFAVFGDMKVPEATDANPVVVFNNTEVSYIGNQWIYLDAQYWVPKHEHSFVAVYPISVVGSESLLSYSRSRLSFIYAVSTTSNNQVNKADFKDIIGATHRRYYTNGDVLPVSFSFSHLMSLIDISPGFSDNMMDENAYIQFHKVELTGIKNKATFNIEPAPRSEGIQTDDRMIEVTGQEGENVLTITFADPKKIMNKVANVSLFDDNDAIIMFPQTFAVEADAAILLTYTVNDNPENITVSIPLNQTEWRTGKSYNYKCSLDRVGMIFNTTTINDWVPKDSSGDATSVVDPDK